MSFVVLEHFQVQRQDYSACRDRMLELFRSHVELSTNYVIYVHIIDSESSEYVPVQLVVATYDKLNEALIERVFDVEL